MNNRAYHQRIEGTSALSLNAQPCQARIIRFPEGVVPARRSYGIEAVSKVQVNRGARSQRLNRSMRDQLAGRPLNVMSRLEAAALFTVSTAMAIGAFLIV